MNELMAQPIQLPDTLEDLTKFVLVGREKLVSVRAEIRAIKNLNFAKEVETQKTEEARMISEALLDAQVLIGTMTDKMKISKGGDRKSLSYQADTAVGLIKTKKEALKEVGLSPKQVERYEILANNQDIVEQVKQEARENDDIPTRARVIDLAQRRSRKEKQEQTPDEFNAYMDKCHKTSLKYHDALYKLKFLEVNDTTLKEFAELAVNDIGDGHSISDDYVSLIQEAIPKLLKIEKYLKEAKHHEKIYNFRK